MAVVPVDAVRTARRLGIGGTYFAGKEKLFHDTTRRAYYEYV